MATKKDLVEAYSFSRRRLVTAFVSGAPGGREVEPARPGRAVIGGIAIAILLLAGAAVLKILGSTVEIDDEKAQLLSEKESGADYVLISTGDSPDLTLRPVINITSAKLLLGPDIVPLVVPREKLSDLTPGQPIGILQAPAAPPPASGLIGTGWTACTGSVGEQQLGLKVDVSATPGVEPTPGVSFVVRSQDADGTDAVYLVAESVRDAADGAPRAYAYEVPGDGNAILGAVAGSSVTAAVDVPASWVTTFPPGAALDLSTFGLGRRDLDEKFPGAEPGGVLAGAEVGDVLPVDDSRYLLTADGTLLQLDPFERAVYLGAAGDRVVELPAASARPDLPADDTGLLEETRWPTVTTSEPPSGELCALLQAAPGTAPSVVLARAVPGSDASAAGVEAGAELTSIDPGAGAFVRSGGWFDTEAPTRRLMDGRAIVYEVAGSFETSQLGYDGVPAEVVPDSWLELFEQSVLLSVDAARCPPTSVERTEPCE